MCDRGGGCTNAADATLALKKIQSVLPNRSTSAGLPRWPGLNSARPQLFGKNSAIGYGYCTDYVKLEYKSATGKDLPFLGNAATWYDQALKTKGFATLPASDISKAPPGSFAVWSDGGYGHVGIVKSNDGVSSITFAEANWGAVETNGKSAEAAKFLRDEAITSRFNIVDINSRSYASATLRSNKYKLIGFIIPQ